ncbi:MAG TPA: serine/threonine protein kinase [Porticoccaceae bacterium]|nr:serine/threonine protein kinase [Porticoccaceae bacterium]
MHKVHPFDTLTPDFLIAAIESTGAVCDGRMFPLNSYENRVYQIGIEAGEPIIAKFYRPNRWSEDQIREEHEFCFELVEAELPVIAPWKNTVNESLFCYGDFRFALFPRRGGHAPELESLDNLFAIGRLMGRMHLVGASKSFRARPVLDVQSYGRESVETLLEGFIPDSLREAYESLANDLLKAIDEVFAAQADTPLLRIHGDCHAGNMLWRDDTMHFVDFDDARTGPAVQDLWMLLSGDAREQSVQLSEIVSGYEEFFEFLPRQLALVESLRTLRIMHYVAWIARRWQDPAFPRAFPWFNTERFWGEHILTLREQLAALAEPPLRLQ